MNHPILAVAIGGSPSQGRLEVGPVIVSPAVIGALAVGLVLALAAPSTAADPAGEADTAAAHAPLTLVDGRLWTGPDEEGGEIAEVSAYCTACHGDDGGGESELADHPGWAPLRDHPVDVAYPAADPGYRSAAELAPALLLLDGRVTCVTCHAHDDPGHAPVLPTDGSQICRACHLM